VSRSTVREALRLLASQGLIVTTRGVAGGSFVAHPSPDHLAETLSTGVGLMFSNSVVAAHDLLEARGLIEVPAASLAARRRDDADLEALSGALFDPYNDTVDQMTVAHMAFHVALARACGNPMMELLMRPMLFIANAREIVAGLDREFWAKIDREHRAILEAIREQDMSEAAAATSEHLDYLKVVFGGAVSAVPGFAAIVSASDEA
jgi:GntR family transcriptional regulator, transcriptional repressor for pyruvate dehydrogenase complex